MSNRDVLQRFYEAEARFMVAEGTVKANSFDHFSGNFLTVRSG